MSDEEKRQARGTMFDRKISVGNLIWLATLLVSLGMLLQRINDIQDDHVVIERRLEKKIEIMNDQARRINELEISVARLEERIER